MISSGTSARPRRIEIGEPHSLAGDLVGSDEKQIDGLFHSNRF
jgi:hypothetical protein